MFFAVEVQDVSGHNSLIFQEDVQTKQETEKENENENENEKEAKSISHPSYEIYPFEYVNIIFQDSYSTGQPNQSACSSPDVLCIPILLDVNLLSRNYIVGG